MTCCPKEHIYAALIELGSTEDVRGFCVERLVAGDQQNPEAIP